LPQDFEPTKRLVLRKCRFLKNSHVFVCHMTSRQGRGLNAINR